MNVLVVYCHPDPASFVAAARDRVLAALDRDGHVVRLTDLYAEGFDPCFDAHDRRTHLEPGTAPALQRHADDLRWCEALVLVYPTWWSGQPAMLKGWIDRVWANGVAWTLPAGSNRLRPLLANVRRIVVVTTHGSSKVVNALQGESGKRVATRGDGDFVGEIALLEDTKRTATVTAKTPLRQFVLTRQDFRLLVNENRSVERKVMKAIARRVVEISADPTLA